MVDDDGVVTDAVPRAPLRRVQTPQGFDRATLVGGLRRLLDAGAELTDDAAVVRAAGVPVATVAGDERAAKVTVAHDLALAELVRARRRSEARGDRPAPGRHRHRRPPVEPGRACRLAGLEWPGADGCAGHSDGDVVAHALTDAVLSAAGLGDIGGLLGTDDPRWAGARGAAVLEHVREVLAAAGWQVGNASVQLIAHQPRSSVRAGPRPRPRCRPRWAPRSASRATTTDGLGLTGRGEGRAAVATALVVRTGRPASAEARPALRRLPAVSLRLYDTAARAVRDFTPLRAGQASVYVCGLTVQGRPHVGHVRAALAFDVLRRWLTAQRARRHLRPQRHRHRRQDPRQGRRRTASRGGPGPTTTSGPCTRAYDVLGVLPPTYEPRATGHVPEMVELMQRLIERGHAYAVDGDVYFDVRSFPEYGALTGQKLDDLQPAADTDTDERKRDPRDFALWKAHKDGEPETASWPTPVGPRPSGLAPGVLGDGRAVPRRRSSTSTAAAWTCASRTTRTSRPSRGRPATASPATGCTTAGSPSAARR